MASYEHRRTMGVKHRVALQFFVIFLLFAVSFLLALVAHSVILFELSKIKAVEIPSQIGDRAALSIKKYAEGIQTHLHIIARHADSGTLPTFVQELLNGPVPAIDAALFSLDGVAQWSIVGDERTPVSPLTPFLVSATRGEKYIGQPFLREGNIPVVEWAVPVRATTTNLVVGAFWIVVDLRPVTELLKREVMGKMSIIDQTGTIRLSDDASLTVYPKKFFEPERKLSDTHHRRDEGGNRVVTVSRNLEPTPWHLVVDVPLSSLYEEVYYSLVLIGVLIVAIICMCAYIFFFFYREITLPVARMRRAMAAFADGDMSARVPRIGANELGLLARTFNDFAERIASEPNRLREEVEHRTKELQVANQKLQELVAEVQENSKKLMEKERRLVDANTELESLNQERERVATALMRRDHELTEANKRLEELDKVKSEFVAVAAHQLRTPLTGIRWALKGLINHEFGDLNADQLNAVANGLTATESAINLINDLLDTARIEGGRYGFQFVVGPIKPLLDRVVERQLARAQKKGLTIIPADIDDTLCVRHDKERLIIAIENAVDNAIKYTEPPGSITIKVNQTEERIIIEVRDTGIGVPKEYQHRLFTKFFRAPNAMLLQTAGTGLGLYLMRNIIEKHDGTVTIESEEGKGTIMRFNLPSVRCE